MAERSLTDLAREICLAEALQPGWHHEMSDCGHCKDNLRALQRVRAESLKLACEAVCQWCATVGQSPNVDWDVCDESGYHPAKGCKSTYKNYGECNALAIRRAFAAAQDDPEVSR